MRSIDATDLSAVLDVARSDLERMRGKCIFITGATGFVGSWLLETAAYANRVAGLDLRVVALLEPGTEPRSAPPHLADLDGVSSSKETSGRSTMRVSRRRAGMRERSTP